MKKFSYTLALTLLPLAAAPAVAQFSAQPVIMPITVGETPVSQNISLRNEGETELQFRIYAMDFDQDAVGEHTFRPLGEGRGSCAQRISITPTTAVLRAGERQDVQVTMAPGAGTCWGVVMLETLRPNGAGSVVGQRIAVKVYGTRADATLDAEVASVTAAPTRGDSVAVTVDTRNLGTAPLRPKGTVEVRTATGTVVSKTELPVMSLLPGNRGRLHVLVPRPPASGTYQVVPVLDFGGDFLAGGQTQLVVP